MTKDQERSVSLKQVKDAARLLLGTGRLVPGAEIGIKALVTLLAATSAITETNIDKA